MDLTKTGRIQHVDLTVDDAEQASAFYQRVVGWTIQPLQMGDYDDYIMMDAQNQEPLAGICHAKGSNAYLPPQWLLYIRVENLDQSLEACKQLGGKVIGEKRKMGKDAFYCLIQDPQGAYVMLCG